MRLKTESIQKNNDLDVNVFTTSTHKKRLFHYISIILYFTEYQINKHFPKPCSSKILKLRIVQPGVGEVKVCRKNVKLVEYCKACKLILLTQNL